MTNWEEQEQIHRLAPLTKAAEAMEADELPDSEEFQRELERQENEDKYFKPIATTCRRLMEELPDAFNNMGAIRQIICKVEHGDVNMENSLNRLKREFDCDIYEAAARHFQNLYSEAQKVTIDGKNTIAEVYPWDVGYETEFYIEKFGRLPKTEEEIVNWWLEYDMAHTVPVSGGIRHNISVQDQAEQLMAMSVYAPGIMSRVKTLYADEKYDKVVALLADCDIHKRRIELMPIADNLRANSPHKIKICRLIQDNQQLESLNEEEADDRERTRADDRSTSPSHV